MAQCIVPDCSNEATSPCGRLCVPCHVANFWKRGTIDPSEIGRHFGEPASDAAKRIRSRTRSDEFREPRMYVDVQRVIEALLGDHLDEQAQLWRERFNPEDGVRTFTRVDHEQLAKWILGHLPIRIDMFVCERCENLFIGDYYSASNCNETGENIELCRECCKVIEARLAKKTDPDHESEPESEPS